MASNSKVYDDVMLDHIRNARNYERPDRAHRTASADNPLCGDTFQVYVMLDGERIERATFQCECCGIAMASASIMTGWVSGRSRDEVRTMRRRLLAAMAARSTDPLADAPQDHLALLQAIQAAPSRDGCAALAWNALEQAITDD